MKSHGVKILKQNEPAYAEASAWQGEKLDRLEAELAKVRRKRLERATAAG